MHIIKEYLKSLLPDRLYEYLKSLLPDRLYIQLIYWNKYGRWINLRNPQTFNEKLNWLKLYDRNPLYTALVDKYEAKLYVGRIIGDKCVIPTLYVWEGVNEIDFESLPNQFVLKCTHDSGSIIICKDKAIFNIENAIEKLTKALRHNYYLNGREWPYKNVKPRIIAEPYLCDESASELKDYKFFVFHGKAVLIQVDFGRYSNHNRNYYDTNWKLLDIECIYPKDPNAKINKPDKLQDMLAVVEALAKIENYVIPFVRIDLYVLEDDSFRFGEFTFLPEGGMADFKPDEIAIKLGELIKLK